MTLSQALDPLYRSYLRRLDEMAARLPEGTALLEATTRGDDGKLVPGKDGLPLRFDVADARSGETFEVRGARPDAPAAAEVQLERLAVRLAGGNWEALPLVCAFDGEPLAEDAEALADLVRSWAFFAAYGGFAHGMPARGAPGGDGWQGKLHSVAIELHDNELRVLLDLGTCPPLGVEALCAALAAFGDDRQPLAHVTVGGAAPA
jgi:hypothetical protein